MRVMLCLAVSTVLTFFGSVADAEQRSPAHGNELLERDTLNAGTVTVITAPIGGPMSIMGSDMAAVLDDGDKLRVLPILGKGSVQNLIDILRLKNIDMGFVTSDALEFAKTEYNMPYAASTSGISPVSSTTTSTSWHARRLRPCRISKESGFSPSGA